MVTKEQACTASQFHYGECHRQMGPRGGITYVSQERWRRNGATRVWKRTPERWVIPIKHGLRSYAYLTNQNADAFHTEADCPLNQETSP